VGEAVLGGTPRAVWGAIAIAVAIGTLAVAAAPARATTDRADYQAQVNPICASANSQAKALWEAFFQTSAALERKAKKLHGKKRARLERRIDGLFFRLDDEILAVYSAALAQLQLVPPAPGDEGLVTEWLATRQALQNLSAQSNALVQRIDRLFTRQFQDIRSYRAYLRLEKKLKRLERKANALQAQIIPLYEKDIELGAKLGATYCVSEATGTP
jgi:hypothetical protein